MYTFLFFNSFETLVEENVLQKASDANLRKAIQTLVVDGLTYGVRIRTRRGFLSVLV